MPHNKLLSADVNIICSDMMQLSHLSRFDHDTNRGPIGTIVSNLIRSRHNLMSIVIIVLSVENILAANFFFLPLCSFHTYHDSTTIGIAVLIVEQSGLSYPIFSDRITS